MADVPTHEPSPAFPMPPPAVLALATRLREAGFEACFVGGCVRDGLRGARVRDFDLATSAPVDTVLALFPRAVAIGLRHGTVMVPTPDGPTDITTYRGGASLESDLALRDFTVNAMAFDPERGTLIDPFDGRIDLAAHRLRAVGSAAARLAEDPLRALRAARMVATLGLHPDAELEAALPEIRIPLSRVARERIRTELETLLLGGAAEEGVALLFRSGLARSLAPGSHADAAAVVAALPFDLGLRVAALLRGTRAATVTAALRLPRLLARRVELVLRLHPIDADTDASSDAAVRRLLQRGGDDNVDGLVALRRVELTVGHAAEAPDAELARARLDALEQTLARVRARGALALHRFDLALDGQQVMEALGCGPGPRVGRALRFLTERVIEDPARNDESVLRALLDGWMRENGEG